MGGRGFSWVHSASALETNEFAKLGRRARLSSAGGPPGVPKGKRRDTKRRRTRHKKR